MKFFTLFFFALVLAASSFAEDKGLYRARLVEVVDGYSFRGIAMQESQLIFGFARKTDFSQAQMRGFIGRATDFSKAIFNGADLRGSRFSRAVLREADLRGAQLNESDLSFADLRGADLTGADLTDAFALGTRFENARFDSKTRLPFSEETALGRGLRRSP